MTNRKVSTITTILLALVMTPTVVFGAQATIRPRFFSLVPSENHKTNDVLWEWRPQVTIPALKITTSKRGEAKLDAQILTSVGGGISFQKLILVSDGNRNK